MGIPSNYHFSKSQIESYLYCLKTGQCFSRKRRSCIKFYFNKIWIWWAPPFHHNLLTR
ncbi:hypothetical protein V6Z11_A10G226400 [Gossypium hirsutum]